MSSAPPDSRPRSSQHESARNAMSSRRRAGRADHGPVREDPPAVLAVAGDRRKIYAARAGREIEAVPVRAADAQPGFRAGHVHSGGHRVEEVAEAAAPGGAESFWHRCRHGDQVEPPPRRGAEVTGLTAAVEQVKHLVGGR
ncbi:MAG TPA: hypothetical protein VKG61_21905 [Streptosporangiaceae bacterium]|nr:hypothetical protein [Streptosporangiaceae bacterium]